MATGRLPGAVIGQVFRAGTATPRDFPRYAGIIAKGLDLKLFRDASITRGAIEGEQLPFSGVTYTAPLVNPAIPDKARSRLYTSDGRTVAPSRWNFTQSVMGSNVYDQISLDPSIFSTTLTYLVDYVTTDASVRDAVPVDDLREVLSMGDNRGQIRYREGRDFRFTTTTTGPLPGVGNLNPSQRAVSPAVGLNLFAVVTQPGSTGVIKMADTSSYTHNYSRAYTVTCINLGPGGIGARSAQFRVDCIPTSSGSSALPGRSSLQDNSIIFTVDETSPSSFIQPIEHGLVLDFSGSGAPNFGFGTTNYAIGDIKAFSGYGPAIFEADDKLLNTNQFSEVSAVTTVVAITPTIGMGGDITIDAQSNYSGPTNQTYEIECTGNAGTGTEGRSANFRWRTNPKLKALTGSLTATSSSTTLTGSGTSFNTEVAAGDYLFVGNLPAPVKVLTVNSATSITLASAFPFSTLTAKALRVRESTGVVTVSANGSVGYAANRVPIDQGIYLDFSFGASVADNFSPGDTYKFVAKVSRNDYNGKENRNYDLSLTLTSTPHSVTATYVGSTPVSTFGSHAFAEDNPLVLPNNAVVHARNMTASPSRFNAIPMGPSLLPDTFEFSLTFDGLIDWTLETEVTETIGSQDILRDLTGSTTGTVGAYFVLTRRVPTQVVYVSGPSPVFSNIAYNQVAGTTVIYFLSNPGVALTIKYRHAGVEPEAGAAYYMTGYQKRPDSDYDSPQLFTTRDAAREFLAPMTVTNDAAIANEVAWDQDALTLPGVAVCLVKDSDGDGVFTTADYDNAIHVSEQFKGTTDFVVVNQFSAREEFRDSVVNMNDPTVARRRIGYFGFPVSYPIGDEFTSDSRVYTARRELQVYEETVARGTLVVIGNSYGKKTILVDALGDGAVDSIPTQVTLDGSFLAVALAARVASFSEPWNTIYNLPISGFDEVEAMTESQMITLQDAGIICCRVENGSAFYIGTMTTDETEPSTQQLSGTVQRQYVLNRLQDIINRRVIGFVADSPEEAAQKLQGELVAELGSMVSERKIAKYVDENTGSSRAMNPKTDVVAFRDRRDPTRAYFRASWYQKYPLLQIDGVVAVDAPTP